MKKKFFLSTILLSMMLLMPALIGETTVQMQVNSTENVSSSTWINSEGNVTNYQNIDSDGDVGSYHLINSDNSSVGVWINDENIYPGVVNYISQREGRWTKDSSGADLEDVRDEIADMMEECYKARSDGNGFTNSDTERFCYYLEGYMAGIYHNHIYPELHTEIEKVNSSFKNTTQDLGKDIENISSKTEILSMQNQRTWSKSLDWYKQNREKTEETEQELNSSLGSLGNQMGKNISQVKNRIETLEEQEKERLEKENAPMTAQLTSGEGAVYLSLILIMACVIAYMYYEIRQLKKGKPPKTSSGGGQNFLSRVKDKAIHPVAEIMSGFVPFTQTSYSE